MTKAPPDGRGFVLCGYTVLMDAHGWTPDDYDRFEAWARRALAGEPGPMPAIEGERSPVEQRAEGN